MARAGWIAIAVAAAGCGAGDGPVGDAVVEVSAYDYTFDLETRAASAVLALDVIEPGNCVTFAVRAGGLEWVEFDGERMESGALTDGTMTACGRGWDAGDQVALSADIVVPLETWDQSQVGYSVTTDSEGAPFSYLLSWVGGCDRFGPCDPLPDRFAHYRFAVTHPAGTQVLCSGEVTAGDTMTTCEFDHDGGPTYSTFAVVASPSWVERDLGQWGSAGVTLYDMTSAGLGDALDVDAASAFLAWMEDTFGRYPFGDELRLIAGPTYWNGFEHPGNITLNDELATARSAYADGLGHTVLHELAHQWAGDQATLASAHDFVWKEAMAEYLAFVFEDEQLGTGAASASAWKQFAAGALYYPVPEELPPLLDYYGDVYGPGPMVLFRQIEALYSRDQVLAALASLLGDERALSVGDVQAALEDATGADLAGYFATWVHGEGAPRWPRFQVAVEPAGEPGQVNVTVRQQDADADAGLAGCAFAVELRGAGDARHEVWFDLGVDGMAELTVAASPGFEVEGWTFDSRRTTLATESSPGVASAAPVRRHPWVAGD